MGGTFETAMPSTFVSAACGTFETVLSGTIKPPSSAKIHCRLHDNANNLDWALASAKSTNGHFLFCNRFTLDFRDDFRNDLIVHTYFGQ